MATIPPEIWLHVAEFMSSNDVEKMLSFNRTFFQLAMSLRYLRAVFPKIDERDGLRFLRRLRDPGVAQHVRRLRVFAEFSDMFKYGYEAGWYRRHSEYLLNIPEDFLGLRASLDALNDSFDEVIRAMTETITYLTNIKFFYIYWGHLSPSVEHLHPFLTASWGAIGPSVQKLSLITSLAYMPALISTTMTGTFVELRKLKLECQPNRKLEIRDEPCTTSMVATLAPFINKVAPTLTRLTLVAHTPELELASLLDQLGHIPHLTRLYITVSQCESHFLENPTYVSRFLQSHAITLRYFFWQGTLPSDEFRSKDGRSKEELMVNFLSANRPGEAFPDLHKLELPAPESDAGFRLLMQYIKRLASALICLKLWGRYLTYDHVDILVSSFDPRPGGHPRELALWVELLFPELVLLLARTCPRLETLDITTSYVAAVNDSGQIAPQTTEEELSNACKFANRLREYDFHDWSLSHVQISGVDNELCGRLVLLFGECIPSVQTYKESCDKLWYMIDTPDEDLRL